MLAQERVEERVRDPEVPVLELDVRQDLSLRAAAMTAGAKV